MILAIDPGLVTGVALWYLDESGAEVFWSGEVATRFETYDYLAEALPAFRPEVVCESYTITQRTAQLSQQYDALYLIGAAEALCHLHGLTFSMKGPAIKKFSTDAKLKAMGWWNPTKGGHRNDAARHLLYRLSVTGKDPSIIQRLATVV